MVDKEFLTKLHAHTFSTHTQQLYSKQQLHRQGQFTTKWSNVILHTAQQVGGVDAVVEIMIAYAPFNYNNTEYRRCFHFHYTDRQLPILKWLQQTETVSDQTGFCWALMFLIKLTDMKKDKSFHLFSFARTKTITAGRVHSHLSPKMPSMLCLALRSLSSNSFFSISSSSSSSSPFPPNLLRIMRLMALTVKVR